MKATKENLKKLKVYATITNTLKDYVYLREDDKGKYIEYAFIEGAPHDNRCLSWYDSYQEKAYIRNGWVDNLSEEEKRKHLDIIKKKRDERVGQIFELSSFTCGCEEYPEESLNESMRTWKEFHSDEPFVPENHICKVGCPAPICLKDNAKNWTYEEPVKCGCWYLCEIDMPTHVSISIDTAIKLFEQILKENKNG